MGQKPSRPPPAPLPALEPGSLPANEVLVGCPIEEMLHDDCLVVILGFLEFDGLLRAGYVCKRWHSLSQSGLLWKNTKVALKTSLNPSQFQSFLDVGGGSFRHLDLTGCWRLDDDALMALCTCPDLQTLILSGCTSVSDRTVSRLQQHNTNLVSLNLRGTRATSNGLKGALARFPHLRELDLSRCEFLGSVKPSFVNAIQYPLRVLSLGTRNVSFSDEALEKIFEMVTLQELDLSGSIIGIETLASRGTTCDLRLTSLQVQGTSIMSTGLLWVLGSSDGLEQLDVHQTKVDDTFFSLVGKMCPKLKVLNAGDSAIGNAGIKAVMEDCSLSTLSLGKMSAGTSVPLIVSNGERMTYLRLGDADVNRLLPSWKKSASVLPVLHTLVLDTVKRWQSVVDILEAAPNLVELKLTATVFLCCKTVAMCCPNLRSLTAHCHTLNIPKELLLLENLPHLRYVNFCAGGGTSLPLFKCMEMTRQFPSIRQVTICTCRNKESVRLDQCHMMESISVTRTTAAEKARCCFNLFL